MIFTAFLKYFLITYNSFESKYFWKEIMIKCSTLHTFPFFSLCHFVNSTMTKNVLLYQQDKQKITYFVTTFDMNEWRINQSFD